MPDSCLRKALARFDIRLIPNFVNNLILLYNIFPAEKPVRYVLKHGSRFKLDSWLRTNLDQKPCFKTYLTSIFRLFFFCRIVADFSDSM